MTIMVPTDNTAGVGLRALVSQQEVDEVMGILRDKAVKIDRTTWNRRYREYMEKIKTGSDSGSGGKLCPTYSIFTQPAAAMIPQLNNTVLTILLNIYYYSCCIQIPVRLTLNSKTRPRRILRT